MRALITGVTGQDGYYLSRLLIAKGYEVHGAVRPSSQPLPKTLHPDVIIHQCDVTDYTSVLNLVKRLHPDEIYNLAAQSFVPESFTNPFLTTQVNAIGCLNLLEAIKQTKERFPANAVFTKEIKFYQASTSEMYGNEFAQSCLAIDEGTPFEPVSPYGISKLYAHNTTIAYRKAYGLNARCGILFNHESSMRGERFVTQKVCTYVAKLKLLLDKKDGSGETIEIPKLQLGNLDAVRDWGSAAEYVYAMTLMMDQEPDEFVVATGKVHSIKQLCETAFSIIDQDWRTWVNNDPTLYRPQDVHILVGNPKKIKQVLGWVPMVEFKDLIRDMVTSALEKYSAQ